MLRLGARDFGWGTTLEVAAELSGLATLASTQALARVRGGSCARPTAPPLLPTDRRGFVVLGMGKLGGEELNFSSDVDSVYLYSTDEGARRDSSPCTSTTPACRRW